MFVKSLRLKHLATYRRFRGWIPCRLEEIQAPVHRDDNLAVVWLNFSHSAAILLLPWRDDDQTALDSKRG
jgi:hypothetical protein